MTRSTTVKAASSRAAALGTALVLAVSGAAALAPPALAGPAPSCGNQLTWLSDPVFFINSGQGSDAQYIGYQVTPSSAVGDLWVQLGSFTGGTVTLAPGQAASQPSGAVAAGGTVHTYFLASSSGATASSTSFGVSLYDGNPSAGGSLLCTSTNTFTDVEDTITANSNKVTSIDVSAPGSYLGATATVTAVGQTGTIGSGPANDPGVINLAPVAASSFPAGAWRLISTGIVIGTTTYTDELHLPNLASTSDNYTATYTFRAVGSSSASTTVLPVQYIASGTQVKRTGSMPATLPALPAVTNTLTMGKTASPTSLSEGVGGDVAYTVTVSNSGGTAQAIDDVVDTFPAVATYKPGTATVGGSSVANPSVSGTTLRFTGGPYTVPAHGSLAFGYTLTFTGTLGSYTNSAVAHMGVAQIDASADTRSDTPATATVVIGSLPAAPTASPVTGSTAYATATTVSPSLTGTGIDLTKTCVVDPADSVCKTSVTVAGTGTWTVDGTTGDITFTPAALFAGDAVVTYRGFDQYGRAASSTVTITVAEPAAPTASPISTTTPYLTPVTQSPSATGTGLDLTQTCVVDPGDSVCKNSVTVSGVGTWSVDGSTGDITFTPAALFAGTAGPVTYRVHDVFGQSGSSTASVTVSRPAAPHVDDATGTTAAGVAIDLLPAVTGTGIDTAATCVVDPSDSTCKATVTVAGEGTWTVDPTDGTVTFTPVATFHGTATPVTYTVTDAWDRTASGTVTVTVTAEGPHLPLSLRTTTPFRTPVSLQITPTAGSSAIVSYCLVSGSACTTSLTTAQGTWSVTSTGKVTFRPGPSFQGTAGPVTVRATDALDLSATVPVTVVVGAPHLHKVNRTIFFASGSSRISPYSRRLVAALAHQVPTGAFWVRVKVVGYVQPTANRSNDTSLSTARARNVAALLRRDGVTSGSWVVNGLGRAKETTSVARRVWITISWYTA